MYIHPKQNKENSLSLISSLCIYLKKSPFKVNQNFELKYFSFKIEKIQLYSQTWFQKLDKLKHEIIKHY